MAYPLMGHWRPDAAHADHRLCQGCQRRTWHEVNASGELLCRACGHNLGVMPWQPRVLKELRGTR